MHIASISLENFKSFRRAVIPLEPGFTAITGPNGSGKSNIVDAILFVLGERSSKAIRASRLSDLIFNGGKGGSRAGFASVEITLDNSDGSLVGMPRLITIKRVIRRSTTNPDEYSSHFYLNGKSVRLQDVADLVDRALLSPDRLNIVQQGDITRIVEMSPVERRRIIDELAGIARYDEEIEKAQAKREKVLENLEMLSVLEKELASRVEELRAKREKALEYSTLRERLRALEAAMLFVRKRNLEDELRATEDVLEARRRERDETEETLRSVDGEIAEARKRLEEIEGEISRRTGEPLRELRREKEALSTSRGEVLGRLSELEAAVDAEAREITRLMRKRETLEGELSELEEAKERLESDIGEVERRIADARAEASGIVEEMERASEELAKVRDELRKLEDERARILAELAEKRQERGSLERELEALRQETKRIKETLEAAEEEVEEEVDRSGLEEAEKELARVKLELARKEQEYRDLSRILETKRRRLERLKAETELMGPPRSVRAVLSAAREGVLEGVIGTVRELITYPEDLAVAVEVAGGPRLDAIVTEDDSSAASAIEFLKRNALGRATFLPLNKLRTPSPRPRALALRDAEGSMGLLVDHLEFDEKVRRAVEYAFGDTLLFEDLDRARAVMGGVRIVTLEGELIEASGAMTGGSVAKAVARQKELISLEGEVRDLQIRAAALEEEILALREDMEELQERVSHLRSEIAAKEARLAERRLRIEEARREREALRARLAQLNRKLNELTARKLALGEEIPSLSERVGELEGEIESLRSRLESLMGEEARRRLQGLQERILALESEKSSLRESLAGVKERIQSIGRELESLIRELEEREGRRRSRLDEISRLREELGRIEERLTELGKREEEILEAARELSETRKSVEAEIEGLLERRANLENRLKVLEREISGLEARIGELREAMESLDEELKDMPEPEEDLLAADLRTLKRERTRVENRMYELEPVDMTAIEEFERESSRLSDLREKMEKLREEVRSIDSLVRELNRRKKEAFMAVFNRVNEHFRRIFAELAMGEGELLLENRDDPFSGGMTILVRPKGKKAVRLEALSGGEKSLTALAFIFALQQYQPSPVYVLDEVDMFLDAVNAEAIGRKIREFSRSAQFIVVTLRRATLRHADRIVGVTMDQKGVSRVFTQEVPGAGG